MIVALLLLVITFSLAGKSSYPKTTITLIILLSIISLMTILIVELDLWFNESPDLTYGSDARYYWDSTLQFLKQEVRLNEINAPLYIFWQAIVLLSSPSWSFPFVLLANISLFLLSFVLQVRAIELQEKTNLKSKMILLFLIWTNGIVLWMLARGLKEVLILFMMTLLAYLWELRKHRLSFFNKAVNMSIVIAILLGLWYVRPFGTMWGIAYLFGSLLSWKKLWKWVSVSILTLYGLILFAHIIPQINIYRKLFGEPFMNDSTFISDLLAPIRFILGPGPIRSFEQLLTGEVFEVSTRIGDLLIFLGSFVWWLILLAFILNIFIQPRRVGKAISVYSGWYFSALVMMAAYSFIYFGTGDTRHRAFFYLTLAPVIASVFIGPIINKQSRKSSKRVLHFDNRFIRQGN